VYYAENFPINSLSPAPGSILVDTDGRYVYYVLPEGKAIRYWVIVGEDAQAWSGVATVLGPKGGCLACRIGPSTQTRQ
jgi:lipoprotein-anchoring transpeptidase ErfK/SrfK